MHENEHFSDEFLSAIFFSLITVGFLLLDVFFSSGGLESFNSFNIRDSMFRACNFESNSISKEFHRFIFIKIHIELHASEISSKFNFSVYPEGIYSGLSPGEFHSHISSDQLIGVGNFGDINRGLSFSEFTESRPALLVSKGEVNPLVDFVQEKNMFHVFVNWV